MSRDGPALLVVDDIDDNRYTLTRRLKRQGYHNLTEAQNGRQALELLRAQRFDLVLLDIMMPEMNGYEVLEQLKADQALRHIPVIMISAVDEIESVVKCIGLGAEDYLAKPFNPVLLRARVGACLEKKRLRDQIVDALARLERELQTAREIQLSLVPAEFPAPTAGLPVEIFASMDPARQVGGDLYDFFATPGGRFCFLIGDVSDKGAPAALFMARTKTLVRLVATLLRRPDGTPPAPHEIVAWVNEELCRDNAYCMFVTLFLGILDVGTGELQFCDAGHNPPYLIAPDQGLMPLEAAKGMPLGVRRGAPYATRSGRLRPQDCLFLYTDGIPEAMDGQDQLFTQARLEQALRAAGGGDAAQLVARVIADVRAFTAGAAQSDDITALALRLVAMPGPSA